MTDKKPRSSDGAKSAWNRDSIEEAFRPYLELARDSSPQGRKRMRILRAATELFERQGFRKTSVEEIARRAEVAKGTVYLYYTNKQRILVDAIAMQKTVLWSKMEPLFTGEIPERDRLRHYLEIVLTSARDVPLATQILRGDGELAAMMDEIGEDTQFAENVERGEVWAAEMLEQAAPGRFSEEEKRARVGAIMSLGFISVMLTEERVRFGRSFEEIATTLADMIVYGAVHRPPKSEE